MNKDIEEGKKAKIVNYFEGATIHNLVVNGNMTRSGTEYYYGAQPAEKRDEKPAVDLATIIKAVEKSKPFIWGTAALATVFCVCRDIYNLGNNMSGFERQMRDMNIDCPPGTVSNAIRNNPYMHSPVSRWPNERAQPRVLKLVDELQKNVMEVLTEEQTT